MKLSSHSLSALFAASALMGTSQLRAGLVNPGFENPSLTPGVADFFYVPEAAVPGWKTTSADDIIELWTDSYLGVPAFEGSQFAELNATQVATLFQDAAGIAPGSIVGFEFAHRGRLGVDTLQLRITDLGADNVPGGGNDTVLFSKNYSDDNTAWGFYTSIGEAPIIALGNTVRFEYESISAAGGDPTYGNFLDAADFGVGVAIPEPATGLAGLGCVCAVLLGRRRK
jgi:hypothetical protein